MKNHLIRPLILVAATAALGACSTGDRYGNGRVYSTYGYDNYQPYRSYYGWYDGFYYPGSGYYLYDRVGKRHRWNRGHQRYWESRRGNRQVRENWSRYRGDRSWRDNRRSDRRDRRDRRRDR